MPGGRARAQTLGLLDGRVRRLTPSPSGRQALELSAFSSTSLALSEGEILMTAYVIAIDRARIAAM